MRSRTSSRADTEPLTTHEQDRLNTERIENRCTDQRRYWIPVAPAAARYLAKVLRFSSRKAIQNQSLTSSVLNPRSREVGRQTAGERQFRVSAGAPQSGGFRAKPVGYWASVRAQRPQRMLVAISVGGGRGPAVQRSLNLQPKKMAGEESWNPTSDPRWLTLMYFLHHGPLLRLNEDAAPL